MLSEKERAEFEALKNDPDVKLAIREKNKKQREDKERQQLYQYRYLKKKGEKLAKEKKNAK